MFGSYLGLTSFVMSSEKSDLGVMSDSGLGVYGLRYLGIFGSTYFGMSSEKSDLERYGKDKLYTGRESSFLFQGIPGW